MTEHVTRRRTSHVARRMRHTLRVAAASGAALALAGATAGSANAADGFNPAYKLRAGLHHCYSFTAYGAVYGLSVAVVSPYSYWMNNTPGAYSMDAAGKLQFKTGPLPQGSWTSGQATASTASSSVAFKLRSTRGSTLYCYRAA